MNTLRSASLACLALLASGAYACSSASSPKTVGSGGLGGDLGGGGGGANSATSSPSGSEVAVSVVSGALNNNSKSGVALNLHAPKSSTFERALAFVNPIGTAYAATWACSGETLTPAFKGPGSYSFTPPACSVAFDDGQTGKSAWSDAFTLLYGSSCNKLSPSIALQSADCDVTRTSTASGDTRTITGPKGGTYAITHDTNGAGTGWDTSLTPAATDTGVVVSCGTGGCAASRTLVINGSHITGTVDIAGVTANVWDHTVTSDGAGLAITGAADSRSVTGSVTVQHNVLKYVSTTTFSGVTYGTPGCCFPTAGSVSTTYSKGADVGKTETLAFSAVCGESTLTDAQGATAPLTLLHCL